MASKSFKKARTEKQSLWFGESTAQHPEKMRTQPDGNADRSLACGRVMSVFDGVSGVSPPWRPADMSQAVMCNMSDELILRLDQGRNSSLYDAALRDKFHGWSRDTTKGSWLRNLLGQAFYKVQVGGSTTFTSISEQVFSWFRHYARTLNEMRPDRHKLFVLHLCKMHNKLIESGDTSHLNEFSVRKASAKKRPSSAYGC